MERIVRFFVTVSALAFVSLFFYACEGQTPDYAKGSVILLMGVPGIDSLYPDSVVFRSADGLDSVVAVGSDTIDSASGTQGWYSEVMYGSGMLPFTGDGYISFTIDSVHFEIPVNFEAGYFRWDEIKIGGDNALFGLENGDSYPLPIGVSGVDSIYCWHSSRVMAE